MIEVDSVVTNTAIECDLNCYANQWCELQLVEVEDAYGPEEEEEEDSSSILLLLLLLLLVVVSAVAVVAAAAVVVCGSEC